MPLYEYACRACDEPFERLVPAADADRVACPACGAAEPRRLISVIAGTAGKAAPPGCGSGACGNC